jgi:hypothetical protein
MTRTITSAAFAATVLTLVAASSASAQVVAYDHHSTAFGDFFAGRAELALAQGQFLVNQSVAAQNWVQAAAANDQLQYQRAEYRWNLKQMEMKYMEDRATANRQKSALKSANEEASARRLVESAKHGGVIWPIALTQPKFAGSMTLVDSILRNWSSNDLSNDAYRRALATEAGVLRSQVANDKTIDFNSRVDAVRTLSLLQQLATLPAPTTGASTVGPQLAMR